LLAGGRDAWYDDSGKDKRRKGACVRRLIHPAASSASSASVRVGARLQNRVVAFALAVGTGRSGRKRSPMVLCLLVAAAVNVTVLLIVLFAGALFRKDALHFLRS
jgi:precorrin-6B methylase 1